MAIDASSEKIRDMKGTLQITVSEIENIQSNLIRVIGATAEWDDEQGNEYHRLMEKIAQLTNEPKETLEQEIPKLERLGQILDQYNQIHF